MEIVNKVNVVCDAGAERQRQTETERERERNVFSMGKLEKSRKWQTTINDLDVTLNKITDINKDNEKVFCYFTLIIFIFVGLIMSTLQKVILRGKKILPSIKRYFHELALMSSYAKEDVGS